MIHISDHKAQIADVISTVSKIINMEIAVFDEFAQIICTTPTYRKIKGTSVHMPSIKEVFEKGNVVVTTPGQMESCIGCRFVENCPSNIEILASVTVDAVDPCVVSITSFDKDDQTIIKNIKYYIESLELVVQLIGKQLHNLVIAKENEIIRLAHLSQSSEESLITDQEGRVIYNSLHVENCYQAGSNHLDYWVDPAIHDLIIRSTTSLTVEAEVLGEKRILSSKPIKQNQKIVGYQVDIQTTERDITVHTNPFHNFISVSNCMNDLKEMITRIAPSASSVVIYGETGTGKELVARSIHDMSQRKNEKFVAVNCANFPEHLFESEMFGYEEGAFTGAKKGGKLGVFELADGGTVFLDEISELPLLQQTKLLRFLQERTITRVGGVTSYPVDVRIICSTNKDLLSEVQAGNFRKDLYYRINVIKLTVPSLRQRRDDIPYLVDHFINLYKPNINNRISGITPECTDVLQNYDWPGNVRELENCIEYAINLEHGPKITPKALPMEIYQHKAPQAHSIIQENEAIIIRQSLDTFGWDTQGKQQTADHLNISLRTLYRKIRQFNLSDHHSLN
ncbi:MAG TPA: sigma 54-interacting transcriptional regulator [Tissierellia bacterium]|nr:sigma 54-interacting transcriptional regulator [Tissierellia bacterium]